MKTLALACHWLPAALASACTIVVPGKRRRRQDHDRADSDPARRAAAAEAARGERAGRRQPASGRRPTWPTSTPPSWAASATYLETVGLHVENMGLIATYGDQFGPRLLLGRRAGDARRPDPRRCCWRAALASGTNVQDYDQPAAVSSATRWATSATRTCRSRCGCSRRRETSTATARPRRRRT